MMFLDPRDGTGDLLAISQPAHAWVSGQLLRHWASPLDETLLLACEQHDLAWLDWERAPSFDPATGRPHLFRDIGAARHAPRWREAVERAAAAWGWHVALLISRHGTVIYTRFTDRHRTDDADADAAAAEAYVTEQAPLQAAWAAQLGLDPAVLSRESELIAFADTLSLGLCGALPNPLALDGPGVTTGTERYVLAAGGEAGRHTLSPWPFHAETVRIVLEARRLAGGTCRDDAEMRAWVRSAPSHPVTLELSP